MSLDELCNKATDDFSPKCIECKKYDIEEEDTQMCWGCYYETHRDCTKCDEWYLGTTSGLCKTCKDEEEKKSRETATCPYCSEDVLVIESGRCHNCKQTFLHTIYDRDDGEYYCHGCILLP
jgi:hypothetical protein